MGWDKQQWKGDAEGRWKDMHEKTMLKRWWQCVDWNDYGSNNMVLWETCNALSSNLNL
jgi:hypothetical protein